MSQFFFGLPPFPATSPDISQEDHLVPVKGWHDWLIRACDRLEKDSILYTFGETDPEQVKIVCERMRRPDIQVIPLGPTLTV